MSGRLSLRRGGALVLGCFLIFAAPGLAQAFTALAQRSGAAPPHAPPELIAVPPPAVPPRPPAYDPYAGASVPG